jgi:hypothetical protein
MELMAITPITPLTPIIPLTPSCLIRVKAEIKSANAQLYIIRCAPNFGLTYIKTRKKREKK